MLFCAVCWAAVPHQAVQIFRRIPFCPTCANGLFYGLWCAPHKQVHGSVHTVQLSECVLCKSPVCDSAALELGVLLDRMVEERIACGT